MQLLLNQSVEHMARSQFTYNRVSYEITPPKPAQALPVAPTPLIAPQPRLLNRLKGDRVQTIIEKKVLSMKGLECKYLDVRQTINFHKFMFVHEALIFLLG